jgi:hypothetical protein
MFIQTDIQQPTTFQRRTFKQLFCCTLDKAESCLFILIARFNQADMFNGRLHRRSLFLNQA